MIDGSIQIRKEKAFIVLVEFVLEWGGGGGGGVGDTLYRSNHPWNTYLVSSHPFPQHLVLSFKPSVFSLQQANLL